jgi:hypothetical protein
MHFGGDGQKTKYLASYHMNHPYIVHDDLIETLMCEHTEINMKVDEVQQFSFYKQFEKFQ